jgi:predicted nucleic acid-binding protein
MEQKPMSNILIDTDVLIDVSCDISEAIDCLQEIEPYMTLTVSVITQMELLVGCRNNHELQDLEYFLSRFQVISLNERISERSVDLLRRYRLSHGLLIPDALIAATALFFNIPFLTKNQRDYRFIEGLSLLPYPCSLADIGVFPINADTPPTDQDIHFPNTL